MNRVSTALVAGIAANLVTTPVFAQSKVSSECRSEIIELCGKNRSKIQGCLREKMNELPESCQTEVKERMKAREEKKKKD